FCNRCKPEENSKRAAGHQQFRRVVLECYFIQWIVSFQAGPETTFVKPVTLTFAFHGLRPHGPLGFRDFGQTDCTRSQNGKAGTPHNRDWACRRLPLHSTDHQRTPNKPPYLVRIQKRNASAETDVLGSVLLEQITQPPAETAEKKPEQDWFRRAQLTIKVV